MREISAIDRNCRLIKGQVFLWKEGQSWEDLWDLNGEITPPVNSSWKDHGTEHASRVSSRQP